MHPAPPISRRSPRRGLAARRGGAAVEFALTLPILITMIAGVVDYSWYFSQHSAVIAAVRDGARAGAIAGAADAQAEAAAVTRSSLSASGLNGDGATIGTAIIVLGNGDPGVQVDASLAFTPLVNFPLLATPASLNYQLTMRIE